MKKLRAKAELISAIVFALFIAALIVGCVRFDFYLWRLQHPTAPTWTYFFRP